MATQKYEQELGATTAGTLCLAKGCIPPGVDHCQTIQGASWYGSFNAAAALGGKGFQAVLQVKNII
jgi:hypothetical protein